MTTFTDILGTRVNEIEKPKPRPLGTYYAQVKGLPKQKDVKDNLILEYWFKVTSPKELHDPSANIDNLSEWAPMAKAFFLSSEENQYAHRQFLINTLGIDPGPDSSPKTIGEMVSEVPGRQAIVTLKHRPFIDSNNEAQTATDIATVARA